MTWQTSNYGKRQLPRAITAKPSVVAASSDPAPAAVSTMSYHEIDDMRMPEWVTSFRPHQRDATDEIVDAFERGARVVFLDAPTGAGKTLIGEMVRQRLSAKGVYCCSGLELQNQFARDFPEAAVVKGRSNYEVLNPTRRRVTAADCLGQLCSFCTPQPACPYQVATRDAVRADLAVVNTTYLLYKWNLAWPYSNKWETREPELVVADECDTIEGELLAYLELRIRYVDFADLGLEPPPPRTHYKTIAAFFRDRFAPAIARRTAEILKLFEEEEATEEDARWLTKFGRLADSVNRVLRDIDKGNWVRDDERDAFVMKPILVSPYARKYLWDHADRWLCMSATIVSAEQMAADLGLEDDEWELVKVPMTFPIENRPIIVAPIADTSRAMDDDDERKLLDAIEILREKHPGDRMLVHAHSYKLTRQVVDGLKARRQRNVMSYLSARDRTEAIRDYLATPGSIMVAPSLDRGVDFHGDQCRVIVLVKVPYPSLGDKQVAARMHAEGGRGWYSVQAVRSIVQMTGRGVRSATDSATTYVLDSNFGRIFRLNRTLFPAWWREAVDRTYSTKELTR